MLDSDIDDFFKAPKEAEKIQRVGLDQTVLLRRNRVGSQGSLNSLASGVPPRPPVASRTIKPGTPTRHRGSLNSTATKNASLSATQTIDTTNVARKRNGLNLAVEPRSVAQNLGMLRNLDGLSNDSVRKEPFKLNIGTTGKLAPSQQNRTTNWSSSPVKPVILRTSSTESNFSHTRKANNRINMSFDNVKYWEIEKTNAFLAERIQKTKPTYSRMPSEPRALKSRFELKQTKEFFTLQRDNSVRNFRITSEDFFNTSLFCRE